MEKETKRTKRKAKNAENSRENNHSSEENSKEDQEPQEKKETKWIETSFQSPGGNKYKETGKSPKKGKNQEKQKEELADSLKSQKDPEPIPARMKKLTKEFSIFLMTTLKSNFPGAVYSNESMKFAQERFSLLLLLFAQTLTGLIKGDQENDILKLIGLEEGVIKHIEEKLSSNETSDLATLSFFDASLEKMNGPSVIKAIESDVLQGIEQIQGKYSAKLGEMLQNLKSKDQVSFGGLGGLTQSQNDYMASFPQHQQAQQPVANGEASYSQQQMMVFTREIQRLKKASEGKDAAVLKMVEGYLRELVALKEMMGLFRAGKVAKDQLYDVKYFDPVECLDEDMRKILNYKLGEIHEFYLLRIQQLQDKVLSLAKIQLKMKKMLERAVFEPEDSSAKSPEQSSHRKKRQKNLENMGPNLLGDENLNEENNDLLIVERKPEILVHMLGEVCDNSMKRVFESICDKYGKSWIWILMNSAEGYTIKDPYLKKFIVNHDFYHEELTTQRQHAESQLVALMDSTAKEVNALRNELNLKEASLDVMKDKMSMVREEVKYHESIKYERMLVEAIQTKEEFYEKKIKALEEKHKEENSEEKMSKGITEMQRKLSLEKWQSISKVLLLVNKLKERKKDEEDSEKREKGIKEKSQVDHLRPRKASEAADPKEKDGIEQLSAKCSELAQENTAFLIKVKEASEKIHECNQEILLLRDLSEQKTQNEEKLKKQLDLNDSILNMVQNTLKNTLLQIGVPSNECEIFLEELVGTSNRAKNPNGAGSFLASLSHYNGDNMPGKFKNIIQMHQNSLVAIDTIFNEKMVEKSCNTNIAGVKTIITATSEAVGSLQIEIEKRKKLLVRAFACQTTETRVPKFIPGSRLIVFIETGTQANIEQDMLQESKEVQTEGVFTLLPDSEWHSHWDYRGSHTPGSSLGSRRENILPRISTPIKGTPNSRNEQHIRPGSKKQQENNNESAKTWKRDKTKKKLTVRQILNGALSGKEVDIDIRSTSSSKTKKSRGREKKEEPRFKRENEKRIEEEEEEVERSPHSLGPGKSQERRTQETREKIQERSEKSQERREKSQERSEKIQERSEKSQERSGKIQERREKIQERREQQFGERIIDSKGNEVIREFDEGSQDNGNKTPKNKSQFRHYPKDTGPFGPLERKAEFKMKESQREKEQNERTSKEKWNILEGNYPNPIWKKETLVEAKLSKEKEGWGAHLQEEPSGMEQKPHKSIGNSWRNGQMQPNSKEEEMKKMQVIKSSSKETKEPLEKQVKAFESPNPNKEVRDSRPQGTQAASDIHPFAKRHEQSASLPPKLGNPATGTSKKEKQEIQIDVSLPFSSKRQEITPGKSETNQKMLIQSPNEKSTQPVKSTMESPETHPNQGNQNDKEGANSSHFKDFLGTPENMPQRQIPKTKKMKAKHPQKLLDPFEVIDQREKEKEEVFKVDPLGTQGPAFQMVKSVRKREKIEEIARSRREAQSQGSPSKQKPKEHFGKTDGFALALHHSVFGRGKGVGEEIGGGPVFSRLWNDISKRADDFVLKEFEHAKKVAVAWEEQIWDKLESWVGHGQLVEDDHGAIFLQVKMPNEGVSEVRAYPFEGSMMVEMVDMLKVCQELSQVFMETEKERVKIELIREALNARRKETAKEAFRLTHRRSKDPKFNTENSGFPHVAPKQKEQIRLGIKDDSRKARTQGSFVHS